MKYKIESVTGFIAVIFLDEKTIDKFVGNEKRLLCRINGVVELHCAIMKSKLHGYYVILGKAILKKLNCKVGDEVTAIFEKDTSEIQFKINEVLNEVLQTDEKALEVYKSLTDGNKRGLNALITRIKNEQRQIETALLIVEKINKGITQPIKILRK